MAAVRGIGISSGVPEDHNFEQLRRNLNEAAALGVEFAELSVVAMDLIAGARILPPQVRRLKDTIAGRGRLRPTYRTAQTPKAGRRHRTA